MLSAFLGFPGPGQRGDTVSGNLLTAFCGSDVPGGTLVVDVIRDTVLRVTRLSYHFEVESLAEMFPRGANSRCQKPEVMVVPFRGEYYDLIPARESLVRSLIYPVPDPRFPFLGVHFTRRIRGGVDAGPNAVLAFKREGYRRTDFSMRDTTDMLSYPGFWRMAGKYWRNGLDEIYRSFSKRAFVAALQRLVPAIREADLVADGSGVRAQALRRDGSLVDDFQFVRTANILHVGSVPSPAATASLAIGQAIVRMAEQDFGLQR